MKKYTNLIWAFDETLTAYPLMTAELLRDSYTAGYRNFLCTRRDYTELNKWLEPLDVDELFSGFMPTADTLEEILAVHHLSPSASIMLCDRDTDILAARNAGLCGCLFDPTHLHEDLENELRTDSFVALRELLEI